MSTLVVVEERREPRRPSQRTRASSFGEAAQRVTANVRRLRERAGLTQEQLAERAEVDVSYVARVERTAVNLSLRTLAAFAFALEVDVVELLRAAPAPLRRNPGRPSRAT